MTAARSLRGIGKRLLWVELAAMGTPSADRGLGMNRCPRARSDARIAPNRVNSS
jgi:hypothetical protein